MQIKVFHVPQPRYKDEPYAIKVKDLKDYIAQFQQNGVEDDDEVYFYIKNTQLPLVTVADNRAYGNDNAAIVFNLCCE